MKKRKRRMKKEEEKQSFWYTLIRHIHLFSVSQLTILAISKPSNHCPSHRNKV